VNNNIIEKAADNIRILAASMVEKANSGHPGGAMGAAEFMALLYGEFLRFDPEDPNWIARDRYFQDPGHMSASLYSVLALIKKFTVTELADFRQLGTVTPGHPERDVLRGIENTSGPLGQGHAMALGAAIAERFLAERFGGIVAHKTYTLISDGGIQEEIAYGVGRIAGHLKLHNLIMYYDSNKIQLSTPVNVVMSSDIKAQYESWGWRVLEADAHNVDSLRQALNQAQDESERPVLIIGHSIMGKGALTSAGGSFENELSTHGQPISKAGASIEATIKNLGGNPAKPFAIFPEIEEAFNQRLEELKKEVATWKSAKQDWDQHTPNLSATLDSYFSDQAPQIDFSTLALKQNAATRVHSGQLLEAFADLIPNLICSSADLSNSDNTQKFLDKTGAFKAGDFSGNFLQPGVAELTMATICNGMAVHGGVIPVCATFFVFSDYMKPAIRLAALMKLPVKYIWTHDSFRVGEDGPTHQPVEHELQIRLLEKLKNHSGKNSMLVLRPADASETAVAWDMALRNTEGPTGLILTRQDVQSLPAQKDRFAEAQNAKKGGYTISDNTPAGGFPDLYFVANGSDVFLCEQSAQILRSEGRKIRVVSMISDELFRQQPEDYQTSILPKAGPVMGVTCGLPQNLAPLTGPLGTVHGLDRFGDSAPFKVLEEEFGFTPEKISEKARQYLGDFSRKKSELEKLLASL
jgi:transketolase